MVYIFAYLGSFAFVFLRVFQTQNVMHRQRLLVFITSILITLCGLLEVYMFVNNHITIIAPIALGGAMGSVYSMYIHDKYFKAK